MSWDTLERDYRAAQEELDEVGHMIALNKAEEGEAVRRVADTFSTPRPRIVYLAGPMSGYKDFNFPAFRLAAAVMRRAGFIVFNPAETAGGDADQDIRFYMAHNCVALTQSDSIIALPGWADSKGAVAEIALGLRMGLQLFTWEPGTDYLTAVDGFRLQVSWRDWT